MKLSEKLSIILSIVSLSTMLCGGAFWVFKTNELPHRVDTLEGSYDKLSNRVNILEIQLEKNSTKTDMILTAVYEIRSQMFNRKG